MNAGYLTIEEVIDLDEQIFTLRIPNSELLREFKSFTAFHLNVNVKVLNDLYRSIINEDSKLFLKSYQRILTANASYFDLIQENSYTKWCAECHVLLFGICLYIQNDYEVLSNHEAGKGRSDISLKARRSGIPSYVIELKHAKKEDYEKNPEILKDLAIEAIQQIEEMHYNVSLTGDIIHIGLAHHGKNVEMLWVQK